MANLGNYKFRDPSISDYFRFEKEIAYVQQITKSDIHIIIQKTIMPSPAAQTNVESGRTNEFDGTTTPIIVYVISADVKDNGTTPGVGVRSVSVFGIGENDDYIEDTILTNGTAQVAGTVKFKRLINAKAATVGTEKDAAGAIRITNTGQTETYLTIPIATIASIGTRLYLGDGWEGMVLRVCASVIQTEDINKTLLTDGANWVQVFDGGTTTSLLSDQLNMQSIIPIETGVCPCCSIHEGSEDAYWVIKHQSIDTDITAIEIRYEQIFVVWRD